MAKQDHTNNAHNSPQTLVFLCQLSRRNSNEVTTSGGAKLKWDSVKLVIFYQYLAISRKQCKIVTMEGL